MLKGNIAVVFGGASNESEISVITGTMACNVLKKGGVDVLPVYITQKGEFFCGEELADVHGYSAFIAEEHTRCIVANGGIYTLNKKGKTKKFLPVYAALNCCHGGLGEGGGLCGLFGFNAIPLAGADMFASSAFMDKYHTKQLLAALNVPALPYAVVRSMGDIPQAIKAIGFPMVVKPACLGSSIGVSVAQDERQLNVAIGAALCYDKKAICEPYLQSRREINVAVYFSGDETVASDCEEVSSSDSFLTFDDKYAGGGSSRIPADLPQDMAQLIKNIAKKVYVECEMRGIARFDFLLDGDKIYLSEVNTVPGSMGYYLFSKNFGGFYPVLEGVIEQAVTDFADARRKKIITTGILNGIPHTAAKGGKM
ncbi:MAG: ATP-grasp domain-containing protein [Clostridia bacterium]|nr:ATP-grasp domain-containing protein [Clostridia bacterium]